MDVEVHHGLAGGGDAVVAVGVELFVEEGGLLCGGRVEEGGDVAEGDEEEVAGADWISIVAGVAEVVCEDDLICRRVAERAGQGVHAAYPRTRMR